MDSATRDTSDKDARGEGYRVLARKYRPSSFDDLIGQEPMVRTLGNAFTSGRIAQAYMLTGVRGVGKTTTARILARALNYEPKDGEGEGPTLDISEPGRHCAAILESRHVDVMEMDAASHTSIDNIRDIIDSVQYRPLEARYKVYIIDEVHMLSKSAFNALLKTLEEPPDHVKFIFATTEIRKVPITVLSRCQRFDLRRVDAQALVTHLSRIAETEKVEADADALAMIARAAEGSVRDSLSILDQAIAHGGGSVDAATLRAMLGVADRARIADLFEALLRGDTARALELFDNLYAEGADPVAVLNDLAGFTHTVTRLKAIPEAATDAALSEDERTRGAGFGQVLSMAALNRAWQILTKGISEVDQSARPRDAADMVLIRIAHAATLPDPQEAARILREGGGTSGSSSGAPSAGGGGGGPGGGAMASGGGSVMASGRGGASLAIATRSDPAPAAVATAQAAPAPQVRRLKHFEEVPALCAEHRELRLKHDIEGFVRLVRFDPPRIEFALEPNAPNNLVQEISGRLSEWTGERWIAILSRENGDLPIRAQRDQAARAEMDDVLRSPLVRAVKESFPDAEVVSVKTLAELSAPDGEPEGLAPADDGDEEDDFE
ncbi:DNA polymerase III subunit gamma/tau [Tepidamorphus sp. 3E244]|uniref:DNA polymerase III subunit gamma/tau n=1 Tax=Tepidamorphus sp. 3E244 TaxID=3385498 RepID=UPI0038FCD7A6